MDSKKAPRHPPTIIVVHPKEKRSKCTVDRLRKRAGFVFLRFEAPSVPDLANYVRLGIGGPLLGDADRAKGLLVLDATWRYVTGMEREFEHVPVRSLPPWKSAYPRRSKLFDDPEQGLATIEAIHLAYHVLGRETAGLLEGYRWGSEFLELNR